jgi:hypothetical protein
MKPHVPFTSGAVNPFGFVMLFCSIVASLLSVDIVMALGLAHFESNTVGRIAIAGCTFFWSMIFWTICRRAQEVSSIMVAAIIVGFLGAELNIGSIVLVSGTIAKSFSTALREALAGMLFGMFLLIGPIFGIVYGTLYALILIAINRCRQSVAGSFDRAIFASGVWVMVVTTLSSCVCNPWVVTSGFLCGLALAVGCGIRILLRKQWLSRVRNNLVPHWSLVQVEHYEEQDPKQLPWVDHGINTSPFSYLVYLNSPSHPDNYRNLQEQPILVGRVPNTNNNTALIG